MREITTHKVNGLNDALKICVEDEPGDGGASHEYRIEYPRNACFIRFQKGPLNETGPNGISNEALLAIVADRLEGFQSGQYACDTNRDALRHVKLAMEQLHSRTKERVERGVEGTSTI